MFRCSWGTTKGVKFYYLALFFVLFFQFTLYTVVKFLLSLLILQHKALKKRFLLTLYYLECV